MSWLVLRKSEAYRIRDDDDITAERIGPLHQDSPLLEWGSISKTITARLTEQLSRSGSLDLSAPVSEYLPVAKLPIPVDVRSLVMHTSGLPRIPKGMITDVVEERDPYAKYTTSYFDTEVLPTLANQHSGTVGSFDYSNLGYAVLTRLLEVVTGRAWWTLATEEVFTHLGITDVAISPDLERVPVLRSWTGRILHRPDSEAATHRTAATPATRLRQERHPRAAHRSCLTLA